MSVFGVKPQPGQYHDRGHTGYGELAVHSHKDTTRVKPKNSPTNANRRRSERA